MCGIYGYIGKPSAKALQLFEELGLESMVRGTHATGYYGLADNQVVTAKAPGAASLLFQTTTYRSIYNTIPSILIGHNRFATHGDPLNNVNNHPFTSKRFGFIHNGVVGNVAMDIKTTSECDSEKIFRYFLSRFAAYHKHNEAIQDTLKTFDEGTLACALVDNQDRSLYMFHNVGKPLFLARVEELGIIAFASTAEILNKALDTLKIKNVKVQNTAVGRIIKIDENLEITKITVENLRAAYVPVYHPAVGDLLSKPLPKFEKKSATLPNYKNTAWDFWSVPGTPAKTTNQAPGWHKCKLCYKSFVNFAAIRNHLEDKHNVKHPQAQEDCIEFPMKAEAVQQTLMLPYVPNKSGSLPRGCTANPTMKDISRN